MACRPYNTGRCLQLRLFNCPNFGVHFKGGLYLVGVIVYIYNVYNIIITIFIYYYYTIIYIIYYIITLINTYFYYVKHLNVYFPLFLLSSSTLLQPQNVKELRIELLKNVY